MVASTRADREQDNIWIRTPEPDSLKRIDQLLTEQGLDRSRLHSGRDVAIGSNVLSAFLLSRFLSLNRLKAQWFLFDDGDISGRDVINPS
jgi:hypothetical protein